MYLTDSLVEEIEKSTLGQSENSLWFEFRRGRLTASKHHDIFTKINAQNISKSTSIIKPKTTPLVSKILYGSKQFTNPALLWGIQNEKNSFKAFI